jgi:peptidoglycan/LPS O-acetylase OafA/YrhL
VLPLAAILRTRAMRFLGNLAYGVYLVHLIVLSVVVSALAHVGVGFDSSQRPTGGWAPTLAVFLLGSAGSFLVAHILNRRVEAPLIARGREIAARSRARRTRRTIGVAVPEAGVAGEVASP